MVDGTAVLTALESLSVISNYFIMDDDTAEVKRKYEKYIKKLKKKYPEMDDRPL